MAFEKGQSGNPGGRPKENAEIKALARQYGPEAIERLAALMRGEDERVAAAASQALLDRGYGKAAQVVHGAGDDGEHIVISRIEEVIVDPKH